MFSNFDASWKELAAIVFAVIGSAAAVVTGDQTFGDLSTSDWLVIAGGVLGSGALVSFVSKVQAAKAIVAGLGAVVASLTAATVDSSAISTNEWLVAAGLGLGAFLAVYNVNGESTPA